MSSPEDIALEFVGCINNQNLDGLVKLMTEDHRFIDYGGGVSRGREEMRKGWVGYFSAYPEYKIHVSKVTRSGNAVAIIGTTSGSHIPPEIEAKETIIWIAEIENGLVAEWRIYADIDHIRSIE